MSSLEDYHNKTFASVQERTRLRRVSKLLRNWVCGALALGIIASGRVGRARKRALRGDVVTAIYFHKPNNSLFAGCVRWLIKHGYTFITENDLVAMLYQGKTPPKGAVWLSFDDGCKELLEYVLPLVHQYGVPVTLFIPTGIVEGDGIFPWSYEKSTRPSDARARNAITVAELQQISKDYPRVTIGSHTVSHAVTSHLTRDKLVFELGESKRALESWLDTDIKSFAYPVGHYNGHEKRFLAELGYHMAATTENALIHPKTDPYLVPRFSVADEISLPEAICNMVGVWRPAIDPIIRLQRRFQQVPECPKGAPP